MRTRLGKEVPHELVRMLEKQKDLLHIWESLRPSMQSKHIEHIEESDDIVRRKRAVDYVCRSLKSFALRHPERFSFGDQQKNNLRPPRHLF